MIKNTIIKCVNEYLKLIFMECELKYEYSKDFFISSRTKHKVNHFEVT